MTRSQTLFAEARRYIAGGVDSPVRAFAGVGGEPLFFVSGEGAWLTDADGRRLLDFVGSWGPMIVGHAHPRVVAAVQRTASHGLSFGAPHELETALAREVCARVPGAERVRFVSSGTEAAMTALRLARGVTGRERIVKFAGCYHGHSDALLVAAGSGALTLGTPDSPGVPAALAALTHVLPYNDLEAVETLFAARGEEIAAVIVEPVAGNMGCVPPAAGFLEGLRAVTERHGALLIMDEVMTGFRVAAGGAQSLLGVTGDLTVLGKVIGGGLPVGAVAGPAALMEQLAPSGPVYQAGTLSGNPLTMAAGLATLELTAEEGFYTRLAERTRRLAEGLQAAADAAGVPAVVNHVPGMFALYFTERESVRSFADVRGCDTARFAAWFHRMLDAGVYLAPSAYEAGFVSAAHGEAEIDFALDAARRALRALD